MRGSRARPGLSTSEDLLSVLGAARRALVLGIGGGGDVVGALAVARLCESLGAQVTLGGVAWERMPIDPRPGPRSVEEIRGGHPLAERALYATPETTTTEGVPFSEARMAAHLGAETVLIDVSRGAAGVSAAIASAVAATGSDLLVSVDVGGDVVARGGEPQLASPLCDAVMVAGALRAPGVPRSLLAVIGAGCDGELSPAEVLDRVADLGRARAWVGTWSVTPEVADDLEEAAGVVTTEASLQVVRCARGERGQRSIRRGRRRAELGPTGALAFFFDPVRAWDELPLARAVDGSETIEEARAALAARGVRTELDYERSRAG